MIGSGMRFLIISFFVIGMIGAAYLGQIAKRLENLEASRGAEAPAAHLLPNEHPQTWHE